MGSSKKHKDKDRDRDKKREKDKKHEKSRERDRDRHKDKERSKRSDEERDREKRSKRDYGNEYEKRTDRKRPRRNEDDDELLQYAMEENTTNETEDHPAESSSSQGGGVMSLSIEETNKLRVKMGLKPLQVEGSSQANGNKPVSSTSKEDVHIPAINISAKEKEEKMRKKLEEIKEKRRLHKKLSKVKGLGELSDDDDSAASWVAKSRKSQKEKEMAERRAQMLAEMDEEFGIGDLIAGEFATTKKEKVYTSRDLRGLNVEHSQQAIKEGQSMILTIKDSSVLEDADDTLVNVNMLDKERADKNIELKKMRPDYKPYDDEEFDEFGRPKGRTLLSKYDEEIDGEKKKSFKLDMGGRYDASKENELDRIRSSLQNQAVSLQMDRPQLAAEYYTQEEMVKFKRPKKRRKVKKRETLKADELQAVSDSYYVSGDHGSRSLKSILKNKSRDDESRSRDFDDSMDIDFMDPDDNAEILGPESEEKNIELEEDEAQVELQIALQRSRRLKQKSKTTGAEKVAETVALSGKTESEQDQDGSIVLDATSEFCRTLGEIPTYGSAADQEEDEEWRMDIEHEDESEVPQGGWEWVKAQEEKKRKEEEDLESNILDAEPIVGQGIGAALLLAQKKGLLEAAKKKEQKFAGMSELPSVGVIDQDKMREEEKLRGSRYNPSQFREKEGYKPDIKLEYVDESGRALTPKEAFRFLSHKFHGKVSGKMKTEKRAKKSNEDLMLKKMSAVDTPLNTVQLLKEKQMSERSPYLILSGGGKTLASGTTTISKGKR